MKVFWIDGEIEINIWIDLIVFFFKGNEMIIEYFDLFLYEFKYVEIIEKSKMIS